MIPDKIELTPEEVVLVLKWAASVQSFNPSKEEIAIHDRLATFAKAHGLDE